MPYLMRARTDHAAHNFTVLRHIALNLIRWPPFNTRAESRLDDLSSQPPTPIVLNSSVLYKIHAIVLPAQDRG